MEPEEEKKGILEADRGASLSLWDECCLLLFISLLIN